LGQKGFVIVWESKDFPESLIFVVVYEVHLNKRMSVLLCGKMLLSIAEIHQDKEMTLDVPRIGTYKRFHQWLRIHDVQSH